MTTTDNLVELTPLEKDERVDELSKKLETFLTRESGYISLPEDKKSAALTILRSLADMRLENRAALERVAQTLLGDVSPQIKDYITVALNNAARSLTEVATKGVLVIYTGGTIGSAPKDRNDLDSPQVVRPWKELKNATPQIGRLGYPVDAVSFTNALDSCNVGPEHWRTMVKIIQENYNNYEGFVILHGTDSMAYTASALSFMLLDLAKPVVITGSQVAGIVTARNDAHQNIITALLLANPTANKIPLIPEVIICFGNLISRGNRCKKMNVIGYQGFKSPNYPLIGEAGEIITIERKHIRSVPETDLQVYDKLDTNVIMLEVFPGMQNSPILKNILQDENLKGVVLKAYGAGNIPTQPEFLNLFKSFIDKGGIVVVVSSVPEGEVVMGLYETSQVLLDRNLIGGFDLTPEAAMSKLMMLLGNYENDRETVRKLMMQSIAGEQRLSLDTTFFANAAIATVGVSAGTSKEQLVSTDDQDKIDKVMLRFKNVQLNPGNGEQVTLKLSLDDGTVLNVSQRGKIPEHALVVDDSVGESLAIDLSRHKERFVVKLSIGRIQASQKIGFTVAIEGDAAASFSWEAAELNIYTTD